MGIGSNDISLNLVLNDQDFTVSIKNSGRLLTQLRQDLTKTAVGADTAGRHFSSFTGHFKTFMMTVAATRFALMDIDSVFMALPKAVIKTSSEIERMTKLMQGLSTAVDKVADAKLSRAFVFDMAQNSPFSVSALTDAFVKFKSAGIDPTNGSLLALSNSVAKFGGNSETLHRASIAIQQMAGKGVISMEELRQQLGEAVPDAMQMMATGVGLSMGELAASVSKGEVEATSALARMFAVMHARNDGAAEAMMDTWSGLLSRLETKWTLFKYEMGGGDSKDGMFAAARRELSSLIDMFDEGKFQQFAADMADAFSTLVRWVSATVNGIIDLYDEIKVAGELILYYFGTSKVISMIGGMKSQIDLLSASYARSAAAVMAAESEKQVAMKATNASIAGQVAARQATIQKEIEYAAQCQLREGQAQAAIGATSLAIQQMELRWGAAGAKHIAVSQRALTAIRAEEVAVRAQGLAHMANVRAMEAEIIALNGVIAKNTQLAAAQLEVSVASTRVSTAMRMMGTAFTAVGGWITVIGIAISGLIYLWNKLRDDAQESMEIQNRAAQGLSTAKDVERLNSDIEDKDKHMASLGIQSERTAESTKKLYAKDVADRKGLIESRDMAIRNLEQNSLDLGVRRMTRELIENGSKQSAVYQQAMYDKQRSFDEAEKNARATIKDPKLLDARLHEIAQNENTALREDEIKRRTDMVKYYDGQIAELEEKSKGATDKQAKIYKAAGEKLAEERSAQRELLKNASLIGTDYVHAAGKKTTSSTGGGGAEVELKDGLGKQTTRIANDLKLAMDKLKQVVEQAKDYNAYKEIAADEVRKMYDDGAFDVGTRLKNGKKGKDERPDFADDRIKSLIESKAKIAQANDIAATYQQALKEATKLSSETDAMIATLESGGSLSDAGAEIKGSVRTQALIDQLPQLGSAAVDGAKGVDELRIALSKLLEVQKQAEESAKLKDALSGIDSVRKSGEKQLRELGIADAPASQRTRRQFDLEMAELDAQEKERLDKIVGNTEKQEMARLQVQMAYGKQRQALEEKLAQDSQTPMQKLAKEWEDVTTQMQSASTSWANSFVDGIVGAATGAKVEWKSMVASMLTDLLRMNVQKSIGSALQGGIDGLIGVIAPAMSGGKKSGEGSAEASPLSTLLGSAGAALTKFVTGIFGATTATNDSTAAVADGIVNTITETIGIATKVTAEQTATISLMALATAANLAASSLAAAAASSTVSSLFADGGIMSAAGSLPLNKYAMGGVANSPQLAVFGEGRMNEAYVPLPDGRSIPVSFTGGGTTESSGGNNVVISVVVNSGSADSSKSEGDTKGVWQQMTARIKEVVLTELSTQKRPGGLLYQ